MSVDSAATRYTVLRAGTDVTTEIEIKRSIFRCTLRRVTDEAGARALVDEARRAGHDARHHCSAFILGPDRDVRRSSDDGEPSGTAGIPMLEVLAKRETGDGRTDLSDVSAVVTRWFGGILLGAGGLVRAYSEAVSTALDAARLVTRQRVRLVGFDVDVAHAGRLESDLRNAGIVVDPAIYGATTATLSVALDDAAGVVDGLATQLAALTAGGVTRDDLVDLGTVWRDLP